MWPSFPLTDSLTLPSAHGIRSRRCWPRVLRASVRRCAAPSGEGCALDDHRIHSARRRRRGPADVPRHPGKPRGNHDDLRPMRGRGWPGHGVAVDTFARYTRPDGMAAVASCDIYEFARRRDHRRSPPMPSRLTRRTPVHSRRRARKHFVESCQIKYRSLLLPMTRPNGGCVDGKGVHHVHHPRPRQNAGTDA